MHALALVTILLHFFVAKWWIVRLVVASPLSLFPSHSMGFSHLLLPPIHWLLLLSPLHTHLWFVALVFVSCVYYVLIFVKHQNELMMTHVILAFVIVVIAAPNFWIPDLFWNTISWNARFAPSFGELGCSLLPMPKCYCSPIAIDRELFCII